MYSTLYPIYYKRNVLSYIAEIFNWKSLLNGKFKDFSLTI